MPNWDEAAAWYLRMIKERAGGFNDLASDMAVALLGPLEGKDVLDVGSGEGHIARRLARAGARVQATEPTAALFDQALAVERREPQGIRHHRDRAENLDSIPAASVDAVCAVLVLHHVQNLAGALSEAHRVLRAGGELVVVLPHPLTDHPGAGWVDDATATEPRRQLGDYTTEGYWSSEGADIGEEVTAVHDIGWYHRTLSTWLTMLAAPGFCLREVREPTGRQSPRRPTSGPWSDVPRFFALRAAKLQVTAPGG